MRVKLHCNTQKDLNQASLTACPNVTRKRDLKVNRIIQNVNNVLS